MSKAKRQPSGPKALRGSADARRLSVVILEVLGGLRTPTQAAEALSLSLSRYYILETRALQGLIDALEPRARGRQRTPESELADLRKQVKRLENELARHQALVRLAQRSVGVAAPPKSKPAAKGKGKAAGKKVRRTRKPKVRAADAIAALRDEPAEAPSASS